MATKKKITIKEVTEKAKGVFLPIKRKFNDYIDYRYNDECKIADKYEDIIKLIKPSTFIKKRESGLYYTYIKDGDTRRLNYCCNCSNFWDAPLSSSSMYYRTTCPHCSCDYNYTGVPFHKESTLLEKVGNYGIIFEATEDYIIFGSCDITFKYKTPVISEMPKLEDFEACFDESDFEYCVTATDVFIFSPEFGMRKLTEKGTTEKFSLVYFPKKCVPSKSYDELISIAKEYRIKTEDEDLRSIITQLKEIKTARSTTIAAKKAIRAAEVAAEDDYYTSTFKTSDINQLLPKMVKGIKAGFLYSQNGSEKYAKYLCPVCGTLDVSKIKDEAAPNYGEYCNCSCCGEKITLKNNSFYRSYSGSYYDNIAQDYYEFIDYDVDKNKNLVVSMYRVLIKANFKTDEVTKEISNPYRIVYGKDKTICYQNGVRDPYLLGRIYSNNTATLVNNLRGKNNLKEIISDSIFANSGLIQAMNLDNKECTEIQPSLTLNNQYIRTFYKFPILETLMKIGMTEAANGIIKYINTKEDVENYKYNKSAKTPIDFFNLPKLALNMAIKNNFSLSQINTLRGFYSFDMNLEYADYDWATTNFGVTINESNHIIYQLLEASGCKLKKVKDYIENLYYNQCIERSEGARLWLDYIKMMDKLKFSPKQRKKEMFPSSLKKSHDVLNFACKNITIEANSQKFAETVEEAKKYRYTFEDYMLTTPESAEEIVREGIELNHSVAQHIELVVNKNEFICFIRRKDAPDKPLYTVELIDNRIVQVRGNSNAPVVEEEVKFFIKKWAKFKKLEIVSL